MFRWIWLGLLCLLMVVGSGCAVGGNEEVIVSRTIQPQETPLAATETIEPTAVSQLPDPTATTTPSPTNTATPSPTPMVTPTALPTTTPTALTLTTHSWDAEPVLIEYNSLVCVDVCLGEYFSALPSLILYSDGTMIVNRYTGGVGYGFELESRNLAQDEVCALLNTIDLIGFLDYDPTAYYQQNLQFPRLQGSNYMLVSAWKTNAVDPGEITDFLEGGWLTGEVELDPPLLLTYELLRELSLQPLEPYAPERIVASIQKISQDAYEQIPGQDQGEWPLANISLETLFELAIPLETTWLRNVIVEDAEEVSSLINLFGIESAPAPRIYTENGQRYDIAIRALLPYETLASVGYAGKKDVIPGPDLTPATTPLTCTPEDGVVDLYYSLVAGD